MEKLTRLKYTDPRFVQEFRRRRSNYPRLYEKRLLRWLLKAAHSRRQRLGLRGRQPLLILDVGTGYGRDLAWLQAQAGIRAFGIDSSMAMLRMAKKELRIADRTLAQMAVQQLGIRGACVDVIRAQALFHHLAPRSADRAMSEVARVLKTRGLFYLFVRCGKRKGMLNEPDLGPRYFRYFTLGSLRRLLSRHGLVEVEHKRVIAYPHLPCLALLAAKRLRRQG